MTSQEIKNHVETKINKDRVGGYDLEQLWHGIHPDERFQVVFAIKDLMDEGKIEITSKRVFDNVGNADEITSYRKIWK